MRRLLVIATLALTGCGGGNLLDNPGFERDAAAGQPPEGWDWDPLLSDVWLVLDGRAASGEFALHGSGNVTDAADSLTQFVPRSRLLPGRTYRLSASYLPELTDTGASNALRLGVHDASTEFAADSWVAVVESVDPPEAFTWQRLSSTFVMPELEDDLVVRLHVAQDAGGTDWVIWVDDLELTLAD